jgi:hypothetical protein
MGCRQDVSNSIIQHYKKKWGQNFESVSWDGGGSINLTCPDFSILKFRPRVERNLWTYATVGMSLSDAYEGLELHMFAQVASREIEEILVATAAYHLEEATLSLGDTVNFGKGWLQSSGCDHGLISLPYLDGPNLEILDLAASKTRFLWLVPITAREKNFKKEHGIEALEEAFELAGLNYADPTRASIV